MMKFWIIERRLTNILGLWQTIMGKKNKKKDVIEIGLFIKGSF